MTTEPRKMSDLLLSIEERLSVIIKMNAASDMNNKLILDRLNKLLSQSNAPVIQNGAEPPTKQEMLVSTQDEIMQVSNAPIQTRRQPMLEEKIVPTPQTSNSDSKISRQKIPVVQRVNDVKGKDVFMANVLITNLSDGELTKVTTNVVGKWQTRLPFGKYLVKISKLVETDPPVKMEYEQEIEIKDGMSSLQLPVAIIKKS